MAIDRRSLTEYWHGAFDRSKIMYNDPDKRKSPEYILQLAQMRRGIVNFVRLVTGENIPVTFSSGKQSYAGTSDHENYNIILSATDDPDKFDVNVGLALHEATHIILSRRTKHPESIPLYDFLKVFRDADVSEFLPKEMWVDVERIFHSIDPALDETAVREMFRMWVNWLEDRRIDRWMYTRAVGYRGYYDAMYSEYWASPKIGNMMRNKKTHTPTLRHYELHVMNMFNDAWDVDALPGLVEIENIINLPNINRYNNDPLWTTYKSARKEKFSKKILPGGRERLISEGVGYPLDRLPLMIQDALRIMGVILSNVVEADTKPEPAPTEPQGQQADNYDIGSDVAMGSGKDDDDDDDASDDVGDSSGSGNDKVDDGDVADVVKKQRDFLNGDVEKAEIDNAIQHMMESMEASKAKLVTVGDFEGKPKVVVYQEFTRELSKSNVCVSVYNEHDRVMRDVIRDGIRMGNMLVHRLRILGDERPLAYTRQRSGKIDKRLLAELGIGEARVFERNLVESLSPVELHVSVDGSSSMAGEKWYNTMRLVVSLAQAATKLRTFRLVVSVRASSNTTAQVLIAFDSKKDSMKKIISLFPFLRASGGTPEGLCFAALKDEIITMGDRGSRRYLLNISDGEPWFVWATDKTSHVYKGEVAWKHTAAQVNRIRQAGVQVLGYFITRDSAFLRMNTMDPNIPKWSLDVAVRAKLMESAFRQMYGRGAQIIDPTSVGQIARTLNAMFLQQS